MQEDYLIWKSKKIAYYFHTKQITLREFMHWDFIFNGEVTNQYKIEKSLNTKI